jgi:hypothetical protein
MRINHTRGVSMGHIADASLISSCDVLRNHYGGQRVKMTRQDATALRWLWHRDGTRSSTSSKGAAYRLATARRPPAGLDLEPARLETAGGVPRDSASKPATSRPDKESWDFNGNKQDFSKEKNPLKPQANP